MVASIERLPIPDILEICSLDFEKLGANALVLADVSVEAAELALILSSSFIGPEKTIPAAALLALSRTVVKHPPRLDIFFRQLSRGEAIEAASGTFTYAQRTAGHLVRENTLPFLRFAFSQLLETNGA